VAFYAARLDEWEAATRATLELPVTAMTRAELERVLAAIKAMRMILALHRIEVTFAESRDDEYRPVKIPEVQCSVCGWASDIEGSACETLRHLADVFSDHRGYRQEWSL